MLLTPGKFIQVSVIADNYAAKVLSMVKKSENNISIVLIERHDPDGSVYKPFWISAENIVGYAKKPIDVIVDELSKL